MGTDSESSSPLRGWSLEWMPAESLEGDVKARGVRSNGRPAGLVVHAGRGSAAHTVMLGSVDEAMAEPREWLDGLDPYEAMDRIEEAMCELLREEFDEVRAAWERSDAGGS